MTERPLEPIIGVWYVSEESARKGRELARELGASQVVPSPFRFDGETITTRHEHEADWMWRSEDGIYRLDCRWDGEEIHVRTPFDGWKYFVTMKDDIFHRYENSVDWVFLRLPKTKRVKGLQALQLDRPRHDYSINSVGEIEEGWQEAMDSD